MRQLQETLDGWEEEHEAESDRMGKLEAKLAQEMEASRGNFEQQQAKRDQAVRDECARWRQQQQEEAAERHAQLEAAHAAELQAREGAWEAERSELQKRCTKLEAKLQGASFTKTELLAEVPAGQSREHRNPESTRPSMPLTPLYARRRASRSTRRPTKQPSRRWGSPRSSSPHACLTFPPCRWGSTRRSSVPGCRPRFICV